MLPLFNIRKEGTPPDFFGPRDSFGFNLVDLGVFQLGPAVQFIGDRTAQNYKELYGLGNVSYTAQVGAFANFWPLPWLRLRGEVRQGIGGETGVTGDVFLDAIGTFGPWQLSGRAANDAANDGGSKSLFQHNRRTGRRERGGNTDVRPGRASSL